MLRLMCITAHPDDEAGGFGGTLRLYHERGVETAVICLTPGQAASHRGDARNDEELAALRRKEFQASCEILGVTRGLVLNYPDRGLYRQDLFEVVGELTRQIREFRPQVLVTFGPDGGITGHPDHSLASLFASLAFQWAGRSENYAEQLGDGLSPHQAQKLYYHTADFTLPGRPPVMLAPVTTIINIGNRFETKIAAFKAHTTQQPLWSLLESHLRPHGQQELFHLAAQSAIRPMKIEHDLFDGVEE